MVIRLLKRLVWKYRQFRHRRTAPARIARYMRTHPVRKLNLGAGRNLLPGWLNTTLQPIRPETVHLDATRPYPIPDQSFDYVNSEHMFEHLTYVQGQAMLRECYRILKPGGRIRIATPDLERVLALYTAHPSEEQAAYIRWTLENFVPEAPDFSPAFMINKMFHGWGHVFVYDFYTLCTALEQAGFRQVRRWQPGESDDEHLRGIEQHGQLIGSEAMNRFETLVVEAVRPGVS